jgi:hypothetical protein
MDVDRRPHVFGAFWMLCSLQLTKGDICLFPAVVTFEFIKTHVQPILTCSYIPFLALAEWILVSELSPNQ